MHHLKLMPVISKTSVSSRDTAYYTLLHSEYKLKTFMYNMHPLIKTVFSALEKFLFFIKKKKVRFYYFLVKKKRKRKVSSYHKTCPHIILHLYMYHDELMIRNAENTHVQCHVFNKANCHCIIIIIME